MPPKRVGNIAGDDAAVAKAPKRTRKTAAEPKTNDLQPSAKRTKTVTAAAAVSDEIEEPTTSIAPATTSRPVRQTKAKQTADGGEQVETTAKRGRPKKAEPTETKTTAKRGKKAAAVVIPTQSEESQDEDAPVVNGRKAPAKKGKTTTKTTQEDTAKETKAKAKPAPRKNNKKDAAPQPPPEEEEEDEEKEEIVETKPKTAPKGRKAGKTVEKKDITDEEPKPATNTRSLRAKKPVTTVDSQVDEPKPTSKPKGRSKKAKVTFETESDAEEVKPTTARKAAAPKKAKGGKAQTETEAEELKPKRGAAAAKKGKDGNQTESDAEEPKPKGRAAASKKVQDDDQTQSESEETKPKRKGPAPKKGKKNNQAESEVEVPENKPATSRRVAASKKGKTESQTESEAEEAEPAPKRRAPRKNNKDLAPQTEVEEPMPPKKMPARGKKVALANEDSEEPASTAKRTVGGRAKTVKKSEEEEAVQPVKPKRGANRGKAIVPEVLEEDADSESEQEMPKAAKAAAGKKQKAAEAPKPRRGQKAVASEEVQEAPEKSKQPKAKPALKRKALVAESEFDAEAEASSVLHIDEEDPEDAPKLQLRKVVEFVEEPQTSFTQAEEKEPSKPPRSKGKKAQANNKGVDKQKMPDSEPIKNNEKKQPAEAIATQTDDSVDLMSAFATNNTFDIVVAENVEVVETLNSLIDRSVENVSQFDIDIHEETFFAEKRKAEVFDTDESDQNETYDVTKRLKTEQLGKILTLGEPIAGECGAQVTMYKEQRVKRNQARFIKMDEDIGAVSVACGAFHNIFIDQAGRLFSFGCNDDFSLGRVTVDDEEDCMHPAPVDAPEGVTFTKVGAGDIFSAALSSDGRVFVFGNIKDESDKLGLFVDAKRVMMEEDGQMTETKSYESQRTPKEIDLMGKKAIDIAAGSHHLVILTDDSSVFTVGEGSKGQLGRIDLEDLDSINVNRELFFKPAEVTIGSYLKDEKIVKVFAGHWCSFAISNFGNLFAWGLNNFFQLGFKTSLPIRLPKQPDMEYSFQIKPIKVDLPFKVAQVSPGQQHLLLLDEDNNVYSCGDGTYGKLGQPHINTNTTDDKSVESPKLIPASSFENEKIISVTCGDFFSLALSEVGNVFAFGQGGYAVGTTDDTDVFQPTKLVSPTFRDYRISTMSGGSNHLVLIGKHAN